MSRLAVGGLGIGAIALFGAIAWLVFNHQGGWSGDRGTDWVMIALVWASCAFTNYIVAQWWGARSPRSWLALGLVAGPVGLIPALVLAKLKQHVDELKQLYGGGFSSKVVPY